MLAWNLIRVFTTGGVVALFVGAGTNLVSLINSGASLWLTLPLATLYISTLAFLYGFVWETT